MISDRDTTCVHLADTLARRHPRFHAALAGLLERSGVPVRVLPGTRDIWARDFMPIQVNENRFVLFRYDPDYLRPGRWRHLRSDGRAICEAIGLPVVESSLRVDGGNVVKWRDHVIMCDKVFRENAERDRRAIERELMERFEVDRLTFIPTDPDDFTGHADGLVRFLDGSTVLINRYPPGWPFREPLLAALRRASLDPVELPWQPLGNRRLTQATGYYINFLELKKVLVIPAFGLPEDSAAERLVASIRPDVSALDSRGIARHGGVLNCVTWTQLATTRSIDAMVPSASS